MDKAENTCYEVVPLCVPDGLIKWGVGDFWVTGLPAKVWLRRVRRIPARITSIDGSCFCLYINALTHAYNDHNCVCTTYRVAP